MKKWKLSKPDLAWAQVIQLQFSSRKALGKWMQTTGKILEDELWSKIARAEKI